MGFYSHLRNPIARAAFAAHQALAKFGVAERYRRPLRKLVIGRYVSDTMTLELRPGSWDAWTAHPGHEPETHQFIASTFRPGSGVMLDVGAFCGSFSLRYKNSFDGLYAFEASSSNFEALSRNAKASGDWAHPVRAAIAAEPGTLRLYLNNEDTHSLIGEGAFEEVRAISLDAFWKEVGEPKIAFIKIDVEGAEPGVIQGATEVLSRFPTVLAEANGPAEIHELTTLMEARGYRCDRVLDGRNMLFVAA